MPRGTTPFVRKTWELLCDEELESIVSWSRNGETFAILDSDTFSTQVLPQYFKHNNLCSFVRQLNTYGFKKVTTRDSKELEFKHKLFHRDHEELLPHIVRRTGHAKLFGEEGHRQEELLHQLVETNKQLVRRMTEMEEQREVLEGALLSMRQELGETRQLVLQMDSALGWKNHHHGHHHQQQPDYSTTPVHSSRPRGHIIPPPPEGRRAPPTPVHMVAPSPTPPGPPPTPPTSISSGDPGKWNSAFGGITTLPSLSSSPPETTVEWDFPLHDALDLADEFFNSL